MSEEGAKTPMEDEKEDVDVRVPFPELCIRPHSHKVFPRQEFQEAVEEATPETLNGENKPVPSSVQHSRSASLQPSSANSKGHHEENKGAGEAIQQGTPETKPASSATSSLQATPTNSYFSRDGEDIPLPESVSEGFGQHSRVSSKVEDDVKGNPQTEEEQPRAKLTIGKCSWKYPLPCRQLQATYTAGDKVF